MNIKKEGHDRFEVLIRSVYQSVSERLSKIGDIKITPKGGKAVNRKNGVSAWGVGDWGF